MSKVTVSHLFASSDDIWQSALCSAIYGDPKDKKLSEKWVYCFGRGKKYHISYHI